MQFEEIKRRPEGHRDQEKSPAQRLSSLDESPSDPPLEALILPKNPLSRLNQESVLGCLLGTAVGDSLGLPFEQISVKSQERLRKGELRQSLFFGKGMVSDDTEHAALVAQSLISSGDDLSGFQRELGRRIRNWVSFFPAGVGKATLLSGLRMWLRVSPERSGIFSAGNGPCMRSPLLGVVFRDDPEKLLSFVEVSTRMTHTDKKALSGAVAVAVAAALASEGKNVEPNDYLRRVEGLLHIVQEPELIKALDQTVNSLERGNTTREFAASLGLGEGVSGYVLHTVPIVLHSWLGHQNDYKAAVTEVISCGGDCDTTGAIVGAIVGARVGVGGVPAPWREAICDPYVNPRLLKTLSQELVDSFPLGGGQPSGVNPVTHAARNLGFLGIVLAHQTRRWVMGLR